MKYWITCNCRDKAVEKRHEHRNINSRLIEYFFFGIAKLKNNIENKLNLNVWNFTIQRPEHNYLSTKLFAYIVYQIETLKNPEIQQEILKK